MKPMTLQTISKYIEAQVDERHATVIVSGAAVDSRLVELGDLFFALPGSQVDGHEYLEKAAQKGALAAVVSSEYIGSDYGLALISCKDVLKALQSLARRLLAESSLRIVAVLGASSIRVFMALLAPFRARYSRKAPKLVKLIIITATSK